MNPKHFYVIENGWANKYFWFDVLEEINPSTPPYEDMIKKGKFTFSKQSGTTPGDIHCSTISMEFFSKRFVDFLKREKIHDFNYYKIRFARELKDIGDYYHLEFKEKLPAKRPKRGLVGTTFYLKDWQNQKIFAIDTTRIIVVSEDFKNLIEKQKFQNIQFKPIKPA